MVGIHVFQVPYLSMIGIVANGAKWAITFTLFSGYCSLLSIDSFFRRFVKYTYI